MLSLNVQLSWPFFLPMTHANDFWAPVGVSQQTITADSSKYHILLSKMTTEASLVWVKVGKISFNMGKLFSQLWHKLDTVLWCELQVGGLDKRKYYNLPKWQSFSICHIKPQYFNDADLLVLCISNCNNLDSWMDVFCFKNVLSVYFMDV